MNITLKPYFSEFFGTFALVFIGAGSVVTDVYLTLNGSPGIGLLGIAAAHGIILSIMISALYHISGAHFNPAVTIGALVTRKIDTKSAFFYILFQLFGALFGAALLKLCHFEVALTTARLGTPFLGPNVTFGQAVLIETVLTFFLVFVIFATVIDGEGNFPIGGFAIGLTIFADILVGGPLTGAAMNPARAFGPALMMRHWENHLIYWIGPIIGGVIAALVYNGLFVTGKWFGKVEQNF